jgi:hypothetical protein
MFGNQTLLCQVALPVRSCAAATRPDRERARGPVSLDDRLAAINNIYIKKVVETFRAHHALAAH